MSSLRLPDFIVIGAAKCATTSLHAQLAAHPGFCMSTPKEPTFFALDRKYALGLEWYSSVWASPQPGDLCGESSTLYTHRPLCDKTAERMKKDVPHAKLIYCMRHPISRVISDFKFRWTRGETKTDNIDKGVEELYHQLVDVSRYSYQLDPYMELFGPAQILPVFFERLTAYPTEELARIARFVGYRGELVWQSDLVHRNQTGGPFLRMPAGLKRVIRSRPVTFVRKRFVPQDLHNAMKKRFTLEGHPEVKNAQFSPEVHKRLTDIFDADLERLGEWLGVKLTCDTWKDQVTAASLDWVGVQRTQPPAPEVVEKG